MVWRHQNEEKLSVFPFAKVNFPVHNFQVPTKLQYCGSTIISKKSSKHAQFLWKKFKSTLKKYNFNLDGLILPLAFTKVTQKLTMKNVCWQIFEGSAVFLNGKILAKHSQNLSHITFLCATLNYYVYDSQNLDLYVLNCHAVKLNYFMWDDWKRLMNLILVL